MLIFRDSTNESVEYDADTSAVKQLDVSLFLLSAPLTPLVLFVSSFFLHSPPPPSSLRCGGGSEDIRWSLFVRSCMRVSE